MRAKSSHLSLAIAIAACAVAIGAPAASSGAGSQVPRAPVDVPKVDALPGFAEELDGQLSALAATRPSRRASLARRGGLRYHDGRVAVEVMSAPERTDAAVRGLRQLGAGIGSAGAGIVEARLRVGELAALTRQQGVRYIRALVPPPPTSVPGRGVASSGAARAHSLGITGQGVKVMIIDSGYAGLANAQANGDLPASPHYVNLCSNFNGSTHGTQVAEIVHEMAPAAELYLACMDGFADQQVAVQAAVGQDVDVITRSLADLSQARGDGSGGPGTTDAMAAYARSHGILWVNAAGNYARRHWKGTFGDTNSNGYLDWAPGDDSNGLIVSQNQNQCFFLKWDAWPRTSLNYNIYLARRSDNAVVAQSAAVQNGTQPPTEVFCYTNPGPTQEFSLYVHRASGSGNPRIDLTAPGVATTISRPVSAGSVVDSVGAPEVLSVGAACLYDSSLQPYSSLGPTIDGKVRPDVAGPTPVSTTLSSATGCNTGFGGTSAAAPHVAGAAALYKQALGLAPAGLLSVLKRTARDRGPRGTDNLFGAGLLRLNLGPCDRRAATIMGSEGNDVLRGTPGPDVIVGLGGRDKLVGRGGGDRICGGPGPDRLAGGGGGDRLFGQGSADTLRGGPGRDRLVGGPGRDSQKQ